eukprot:scaffold4886_cov123-Isochrysis_galbana.AAC.20
MSPFAPRQLRARHCRVRPEPCYVSPAPDLAEHEIAVHGLRDDGCNLLVRKLDERVVLGGARLRSVSDGGGRGREARVSTWPQAAEPERTRRRRRTLRLRARWIRFTRPNCEKNPFICSS